MAGDYGSGGGSRAFDLDALKQLIEDLEARFDAALFKKVELRHAHFHNLESVDPVLPEPFAAGPRFQDDMPRRIHSQLKARLCENHYVFSVQSPSDSPGQRRPVNLHEAYLNDGFQLVEDRLGMGLQEIMSDGQIISCYAVLHWCKAEDVYPGIPDPEYRDEAPEEAERDRFQPLYRDGDEPEEAESTLEYRLDAEGAVEYAGEGDDRVPRRRQLSRYRETDASVQQRYRKSCADAGFRWLIEGVHPDQVMWVFDRSLEDQPAIGVVRRVVPLLSYIRELEAEEQRTRKALSLHDVDGDIPVYGEQDAPVQGTHVHAGGHDWPSAGGYRDTVTIYQVWTRSEFYEVATGDSVDFRICKSGTHPYRRVPLVIVPAQTVFSPDPVLRYEPALEGVFRLKPFYDRQMSLLQTLAEQTALPYYYWKSVGTGEPMLDEKGTPVTFTRDSASAQKAPEGYELEKVAFEINPAFVDAVRAIQEMREQAAPATGQAEVTTSTQPWAIRLQQAQASVEPGRLMSAQARALKVIAKSISYVESLKAEEGGFDTPAYVYARKENGEIDRETVEELPREGFLTQDIDVTIAAQSAAEKVTLEEHGLNLLRNGVISLDQFTEHYAARENPDDWVLALKATRAFEQFVEPGMTQQVVAQHFGAATVLGQNGQWIGFGGQPLQSADVLRMKGQRPPPGGSAPGGAPAELQPSMPDMAGLRTPETLPLGGVPG